MVQWTMRQALICLIGSTCSTLTLSIAGYAMWSRQRQIHLHDEKFHIKAIIQTGPEREALKTTHLAEILGLSVDDPISIRAFHCEEAVKKLMSSPLIAHAYIKKIPPSTLYIDYEIRKPIAYLSDYKNIAIDKEGYVFPFFPFFSPKEIPEIYLGLPPFSYPEDQMGRKGACWLMPIRNRYFQLALDVLHCLEGVPWREGFCIKRIDVSNAFAPSLGKREIVLLTEEKLILRNQDREICCTFPKMLRVASKDFSEQLHHFFVLRRNMEEEYRKQLTNLAESTRFQSRIIDLRIPQLAFVQNSQNL